VRGELDGLQRQVGDRESLLAVPSQHRVHEHRDGHDGDALDERQQGRAGQRGPVVAGTGQEGGRVEDAVEQRLAGGERDGGEQEQRTHRGGDAPLGPRSAEVVGVDRAGGVGADVLRCCCGQDGHGGLPVAGGGRSRACGFLQRKVTLHRKMRKGPNRTSCGRRNERGRRTWVDEQ
jgi:hypothetical protein